MIQDSLIFDDQFWTTLSYLEDLKGPTDINAILKDTNSDRQYLNQVMKFLSFFKYSFELKVENGVTFYHPPEDKVRVQFDFSLTEWISLQAHFPLMEKNYTDKEFHHTFASKMAEVEAKNPDLDLFRFLKLDENKSLSEKIMFLTKAVENAVQEGKVLSLSHNSGHQTEFYPHCLVYIEGELHTVGEDCGDRCLVFFPLEAIHQFEVNEENHYEANFSHVEVDDFINAIRAINGKEERLILKVTSDHEINLSPDYHFLGSPYITTNLQGERIWAATVEPCDELFDWLKSIQHKVEILDPQNLKQSFQEYCDRTAEESFKKAS